MYFIYAAIWKLHRNTFIGFLWKILTSTGIKKNAFCGLCKRVVLPDSIQDGI